MSTEWARFWSKVDVQSNGGCWLWTASLNNGGYGQFFPRGAPKRSVGAHRYAYEHIVGPIPEGLDLDHLCRVRRCCNPAHLEPVTRQENLRRGDKKPRVANCRKGHPLSGDNVWVRPSDGARICKTCTYAYKRRYRSDPDKLANLRAADAAAKRAKRTRERGGRPAQPNADKTHCPQGHPYEGDNLFIDASGTRRCRACQRAINARAYAKRKGRGVDGV